MKSIIIAVLVSLTGTLATFAQCDKKLILTSSKTEYLNAKYETQRTVEENSVIEINKPDLIIVPGGDGNKMMGTIQSDSCGWKTPYKEGKSIIKVIFNREDGKILNSTITIEGKDGKLTLLLEAVEMPDKKIRVTLDTFEEKK